MPEAVASSANVRNDSPLTPFHRRLFAEELTLKSRDSAERLSTALSESKVDLHPHQVEAAAFALDAMSRGGCMLADEVGLGKTIEAGLVISQLLAEGKAKVLILCPATLRAQWQAELKEKFGIDSVVVDGRSVRATSNCFDQPFPVIASIPFAANRPESVRAVDWSVTVIDEAHRLRNAHHPGHKTGKALKTALANCPKILLTATPLQNGLGELFGLLSLLDEQILGPEHVFKARYASPPTGEDESGADSTAELRERLKPVVQRTLRRQVREYVRYTNRRSMVEDFAPSPEEQELYDNVSEYLRRAEATAIEPGKKTLLTLVYRKLLASSTYAIAPTLKKLAQGIRERLDRAKLEARADFLLLDRDEAQAFAEEAEGWADDPAKGPSIDALTREAFELETYAEAAERIRVNAKGEALKRALERIFTAARANGWPEKAVIFTESKRTQTYLFELLSANGFQNKISLLSGDAGKPEDRKALVDNFRHHTQILISTEAGAEGLNLQFCNLVVNYDLPWNPQRIEQRIGRCHRYGQERDVLVLNFLNRQNAADARLFELLEKKLHLFDGVFGASDEVLGALESGLDFERRILDIYQSCRKPEEIDKAFGALREDLESRIDQRMTETRSLLLERFDGEVRRRLRVAGEQAQAAVKRRSERAHLLAPSASRAELERAAAEARATPIDPVTYLSLDASGLPARLASLAGKEGWWFVYRFDLSALHPDERMVHLVLLKEGNLFRPLPLADAAELSRLRAQPVSGRSPAPIPIAAAQEAALFAAKEELTRGAERACFWELEEARERADRFAEDCLLKPRQAVEEARRAWEEARRELVTQTGYLDRLKSRGVVDRLERDYRRRLSLLHKEEDARLAQKERELVTLTQRAKVADRRVLVGTAYVWLT